MSTKKCHLQKSIPADALNVAPSGTHIRKMRKGEHRTDNEDYFYQFINERAQSPKYSKPEPGYLDKICRTEPLKPKKVQESHHKLHPYLKSDQSDKAVTLQQILQQRKQQLNCGVLADQDIKIVKRRRKTEAEKDLVKQIFKKANRSRHKIGFESKDINKRKRRNKNKNSLIEDGPPYHPTILNQKQLFDRKSDFHIQTKKRKISKNKHSLHALKVMAQLQRQKEKQMLKQYSIEQQQAQKNAQKTPIQVKPKEKIKQRPQQIIQQQTSSQKQDNPTFGQSYQQITRIQQYPSIQSPSRFQQLLKTKVKPKPQIINLDDSDDNIQRAKQQSDQYKKPNWFQTKIQAEDAKIQQQLNQLQRKKNQIQKLSKKLEERQFILQKQKVSEQWQKQQKNALQYKKKLFFQNNNWHINIQNQSPTYKSSDSSQATTDHLAQDKRPKNGFANSQAQNLNISLDNLDKTKQKDALKVIKKQTLTRRKAFLEDEKDDPLQYHLKKWNH